MMESLSQDAKQKMFWELTAEAAKIRERSTPLREKRDKLLASIALEVQQLEKEIREIEAPLYDIENRRGELARALRGKTGEVVDATPHRDNG